MSGTVPRPGLSPVAALPARRDMLAPSRARVAPSLRGMARRHALVRLAKLALPAIALALLCLLLFWPDIAGKEGRMSFRRGPSMVAEALQVTAPLYQGLDELNRPYTVTAQVARQQPGVVAPGAEIIDLDAPRADITMTDGAWIFLESREGVYDRGRNWLDLQGDVTIYHDNGTRFRSETAAVDLTAGSASSRRPTQAQGPFGTIVSEGFELTERGAVMVFTGRARAVLEGRQK
ncbi:MAG: LPS export ABC transporter periplasmic protein LptC [Rubritepida sp.]|nr:LPS export ABC transporter periplasmic protein LptC [Rubritepida sp.]